MRLHDVCSDGIYSCPGNGEGLSLLHQNIPEVGRLVRRSSRDFSHLSYVPFKNRELKKGFTYGNFFPFRVLCAFISMLLLCPTEFRGEKILFCLKCDFYCLQTTAES
ncbi:hypothetical protein CEXT_751871 [Caerostris extrusa]|uniref:Uncharacterized protein n=1 Tax=Caerostris extrusa TaxID=172846 RepID=A0AAV4TK70_CAEEX|nr:hypothetical protein CEXT_751871 [Caerostris extrusa]